MNKPSDPALAIALKYLKVAERTEAELRSHLGSKGVSEDDAERVIGLVVARKFVSDKRLAEREIELARGPKMAGREKTRARLLARGADESLVEEAARSYTDAEETENALRLVSKKYKTSDDPAKAARFLLGRGFGEETVRAVLERFFPGLES